MSPFACTTLRFYFNLALGKGQQCKDQSNLIQVVLYKSSPTLEIILGDGLIDEHSRTYSLT